MASDTSAIVKRAQQEVDKANKLQSSAEGSKPVRKASAGAKPGYDLPAAMRGVANAAKGAWDTIKNTSSTPEEIQSIKDKSTNIEDYKKQYGPLIPPK